jgi:S1-C subfamily serine protease
VKKLIAGGLAAPAVARLIGAAGAADASDKCVNPPGTLRSGVTPNGGRSMKVRGAACVFALAAAAALAACGGGSDEPEGPQKLGSRALVKHSGPSTVKVYGKYGDEMTAGTGVVIDAKHGYVLTNAHVLEGATGIKAQINEEPEEYTARIRATAPCDDLALVELTTPPAAGVKAMPIGSSRKVRAGQHVTTLGYPGTLEENPTAPGSSKLVFADGRVSTPETTTELFGFGEYPSLIQHTAAVNHGNSGGPLVDDYGRLIGVNTLGNPDAEQQYYSITIDHAKPVIEKLKQGISLSDVGWTLSPFRPAIARKYLGRKDFLYAMNVMIEDQDVNGVYVLDTRAGTPSERVNITSGDYISSIDGNLVTTPSEVCDAFESATPGSIVKVRGRYLDSAYSVEDPDIWPGDTWTQNVRVPPEEAAQPVPASN